MKYYLYLLSFLFIGSSMAQDFEVAPVVLNFNANPGEIQQATVTLRNHANVKQAFTFNIGDFEVNQEGQKKRMPAGTSKRSCADWITISPSLVELNPNEEVQVSVIMTVPKNGISSRWSMIYVQTTSEQSDNPVDKQLATGIKIRPRIVVLVNQSPKSNTNYKATISDLVEVTTPKDTVRTFNVSVLNTGDKIIEANVQLILANVTTAQEEKYKKIMNRVYPGEKRVFVLTLPQITSTGIGRHALAALLDYGHGTTLEAVQLMIDI